MKCSVSVGEGTILLCGGCCRTAGGFGMLAAMSKSVTILGAGLAGCEAALQLADRGFSVKLMEMRPSLTTPVHRTGRCAELVCSNSLKGVKASSAPGMLKGELDALDSRLMGIARRHAVAAGGALAVDRDAFSKEVDDRIEGHENINLVRQEATSVRAAADDADALVIATGPLTSDALAADLSGLTGQAHLSFYDAAAPIVMADSLDARRLFRQSRYEDGGDVPGDYLNAPFSKEEYDSFVGELLGAQRVIRRTFESKDLFQACQPVEEVARAGWDAPRFGMLKPVGLTDPRTGRRPWAALQLRAEDACGMSYNLVGFQTNLTFPEQKRVFRMIPGLERAEFSRYGVMHRNTFVDAPRLLDAELRLACPSGKGMPSPVFLAGQLAGTEGYCEAIRSGLHVALALAAEFGSVDLPELPCETAFGALMAYATDPATKDYQPMHVNFGIMPPLDPPVRNKRARYEAYAARGAEALLDYRAHLVERDLLVQEGPR